MRLSGGYRAFVMIAVWGMLLGFGAGCQKDPMAQALETLEKGTPDERLQAAQILVQANRTRVAEDVLARIPAALEKALQDENAEVRLTVARGAPSWGHPQLTRAAVTAMRQDVLSDDREVARRAAEVLEAISGEESTQALTVALRSSFPEVRRVAARTLARRNAQLSGEDRVRMYLALRNYEAVVGMGQEALPVLRALLKADPMLQAHAAIVLARLGDESDRNQAMEAMLRAVESEDPQIRATAAQALGALRDQRGTAVLQNLATNDPDPTVRAVARVAAYLVEDDVVSLTRSLEDSDPTVQLQAVQAIRYVSDPTPAVAPLIRLLRRTTNARLAEESIRTLGACGSRALGPLLEALAEEPEWNLRLRLVQALSAAARPQQVSSQQLLDLYDLYEKEANDVVKSELGQLLALLQEE
ncbi:MAG: hypothetical protein KatS3mg115_2623 [Candidatus Poribacteria bacterium]|nr:MAG: hypothetical protein KatS3mg115_2623 [Candidatus Poribacteria bacterium]